MPSHTFSLHPAVPHGVFETLKVQRILQHVPTALSLFPCVPCHVAELDYPQVEGGEELST